MLSRGTKSMVYRGVYISENKSPKHAVSLRVTLAKVGDKPSSSFALEHLFSGVLGRLSSDTFNANIPLNVGEA